MTHSSRSILNHRILPLLCWPLAATLGGCGDAAQQQVRPTDAAQPMTVSQGANLSFDLSPDGQTLVLSLHGALFTLPVSGGSAERLTGLDHDARQPDWSPGGSQIVFHGNRNGASDLWRIEVGEHGASAPVALTADAFDNREAHHSPSGEHIVFASDRSGNFDLWLYATSDGSLTQLTETPENEHTPAWSPDGDQIAHAAVLDTGRSELRILDVDGGKTSKVAEEPGVISGVNWSPRGQALTYQLARPGSTQLKVAAGDEGILLSRDDDDVFPFRTAWLDEQSLLFAANGRINRLTANGERNEVPFEASFDAGQLERLLEERSEEPQ